MKKFLFLPLISFAFLTGCAPEQPADEAGESSKEEGAQVEEMPHEITPASVLFVESGDAGSWIESQKEPGYSTPACFVDTDKDGAFMAYVTGENRTLENGISLNLDEFHHGPFEQPFRVSIHIKVKDYKTWKWLFDGEKKSRENAGMSMVYLGTRTDDPNDVYMLLALPDIALARTMMEKPGVRERLIQSGVIGEPEVMFLRKP